jgi:hypothetical protein
MALARLIRAIAAVVAAIIVAGILLKVLGANANNTIVSDVHDVGQWLVGPFKGLFSVGSAKVTMAVNWGIAALVYLIVAHLIARLIAMAAVRGSARSRRRVSRPAA